MGSVGTLVTHFRADRLCLGSMCLRLRRILAHHASLPYSRKVYMGTSAGHPKNGEAEGKGRIVLAGRGI